MMDMNRKTKSIVRILSIDGGGIRGAAVASFLKQLEAHIGRPINESFDFFAGTSVGGILTAAMVYGELSAEDICDKLMTPEVGEQMMPSSFIDKLVSVAQVQPKFSGKGKRDVINKYCGTNRSYCPKEWDKRRDLPFCLLTSYDLVQGRPVLHKNWDDDNDELVSDVVDQTSAAPAYYPVVSSYTPISGVKRGIDGAVFANNPTDCAYAEALKVFGVDADIRVLSIGTGESDVAPIGI